MFSASVVLKHIHKVTEKLIFTSFTCPFEYCDIELPRLSELLHTAQKDGKLNLNDTKAKRIENPLKYKAFGIQHVKSSRDRPPVGMFTAMLVLSGIVIFDNPACSNSFTRFKGDQVASRSNLSLLLCLLSSFIIPLIKVD